ncbi:hypothetical protein [Deinococcus sp. 23YEL01]|uniref:hypothetical protein n=1 Tax=Deinococcus sp. 23YEL01 TaxID=2745871 RepID=UPI001E3EDFB0|nr:hypothetical protein [Deinococcus sp. 23YEL01]MCD0168147.1 hypothetical protein [Deinococcus sp. 23YEL01]
MGRQGASVGCKPHSGLRDCTLSDLEVSEEVHDPTDAADREAQLVMQGLKGGVQDGAESVGRGTDLIGFQVRMVTTHCVVTLRALHNGHVILGDLHGVLGDEFRDPGLVLTGEDQQAQPVPTGARPHQRPCLCFVQRNPFAESTLGP